ncbi:hypothetical protein VTJ04DRAFT_7522 [Mycothermus thermophilus]|uniref:uncharacterized protein n=1 Tax=Humicola insolens TaxID=85995 RepID=UPI003742568C
MLEALHVQPVLGETQCQDSEAWFSPSVHLGPKRLAAHCSNNHKAKERLHKKQSKTPEQRMTRYPNQPSSTFIQPK